MCPVFTNRARLDSAALVLNAIPVVARATWADNLNLDRYIDVEVTRQLDSFTNGEPAGQRLVEVVARGFLINGVRK